MVGGCFKGLFTTFRRKDSRRPTVEPYPFTASPVPAEPSTWPRVQSKDAFEHEDFGGCLHKSYCDFGYGRAGEPWDEKLKGPPSYSEGNKDDVSRPEVLQTIEETIDELSAELRKLNLDIHDHPEIMFQERHAHDTLTSFMSAHGFTVTKHYLGLETAWRAEFSHGENGRVLGVNSEMDALPGIGHACGHNLIAISGVGIALAVRAALEKHDIPGKVVLLGTPAEEGGGGKTILIERGGYKDMDVCLMSHPGPGPSHSVGLGSSLSVQSIEVEYFGHTAHASAAPWEGTNALDAAFLAYSSISVLRQQIKPTHRVHGVIRGNGEDLAANIIPDHTKMLWLVRAPTYAEVEVLRERVKACFEAAALATACRIKISTATAQYDLRQNRFLSDEFSSIMGTRYGWETTMAEGAIGGSTDFGNVTYELPSIHPSYAIPTEPNGGNHTPGFTASARTKEAHKLCLTVTKGLAAVGMRVLADAHFARKVKSGFEHHRIIRS